MKYILYCRKSQESEDRQIMSLDAQEQELRERALTLGIQIVAVYHESMSAKTPGRPVFTHVIEEIKQGKADGILCWKLDRLARNFIEAGIVIELLQTNILKSIQTFDKEYLPKDNVLTMAVELGMANQYSRDLSENVKRGNRAKIKQGGWPCRAPFGYLNNKADKTLFIDPVRGQYVQRMYELYSTGLYSLRELADKLYEEGLRTQKGKKVYCGNIQKILRNPIYHGVIRYRGGFHPANFESLVTKNEFDLCQEVMNNTRKSRKIRHFFPLTGLFKCEVCGCAVTAEKQKEYHYYHCTNGKGVCDQKPKFVREENLELELMRVFETLSFDEELVDLMYQAAKESIDTVGENNTTLITNTQREIDLLQARESRLLDTYLEGNIEKEIFEQKQSVLKQERIALQKNLEDLSKNQNNPYTTLERTKKVFLTSNRARLRYLKASPEQKREIAFELLSNATLKDRKMANYKLKSPYDIIAKAPKNADFSLMCE